MFLISPKTLLKFLVGPNLMKAAGITTWFQFTQRQYLFCHQGQKRMSILASCPLFCRWFGYYFASVWKIDTTSLHVNVAVYFAQILKIFARIMANFSALGMRPHPLLPHAVRLYSWYLCTGPYTGFKICWGKVHFWGGKIFFVLQV